MHACQGDGAGRYVDNLNADQMQSERWHPVGMMNEKRLSGDFGLNDRAGYRIIRVMKQEQPTRTQLTKALEQLFQPIGQLRAR